MLPSGQMATSGPLTAPSMQEPSPQASFELGVWIKEPFRQSIEESDYEPRWRKRARHTDIRWVKQGQNNNARNVRGAQGEMGEDGQHTNAWVYMRSMSLWRPSTLWKKNPLTKFEKWPDDLVTAIPSQLKNGTGGHSIASLKTGTRRVEKNKSEASWTFIFFWKAIYFSNISYTNYLKK